MDSLGYTETMSEGRFLRPEKRIELRLWLTICSVLYIHVLIEATKIEQLRRLDRRAILLTHRSQELVFPLRHSGNDT
jgi:hypothetical protein